MSRSRKAPFFVDGPHPHAKRKAARRVRHCADVPDGGGYRRVSQSYDICDFVFHAPEDPRARRK